MYRLPTHCSLCNFVGMRHDDFVDLDAEDWIDMKRGEYDFQKLSYCFLFEDYLPHHGKLMQCQTNAEVKIISI